jgi:F-type H+-transporting ATPase subunit gamma
MESIKDIQSRLQGMQDIKHLLRSVRAMSAIRWRRAKKHLAVAQTYAKYIDNQLGTLLAKVGTGLPKSMTAHVLTKNQRVNVGLITLTSDRGLCGSFNTGLVAKAIHVTEILNRKNKDVKIISLGGYGEPLFRSAGYEIFHSEKISNSQAVSFINIRKAIAHIRAFYETGVIDELNILYNQFNYFGSYTPKSIQILPPQISELQEEANPSADDLIINSDPEELKAFLLWEHLAAQLYMTFIESTVSEHSARLQTMDSAISNLDERVGELEIRFHTIRQEKITQGVLEVQSNMRKRKRQERLK